MPDKKTPPVDHATIQMSTRELMYSIYQKQSGAAPQPFLSGEEGEFRGKSFLLIATRIRLGRSHKCNIHFEDRTVSSYHAQIERQDDTWVIKDLSSRNGTLVNDKKITSIQLNNGDVIRIGRSTLRLNIPAKKS